MLLSYPYTTVFYHTHLTPFFLRVLSFYSMSLSPSHTSIPHPALHPRHSPRPPSSLCRCYTKLVLHSSSLTPHPMSALDAFLIFDYPPAYPILYSSFLFLLFYFLLFLLAYSHIHFFEKGGNALTSILHITIVANPGFKKLFNFGLIILLILF